MLCVLTAPACGEVLASSDDGALDAGADGRVGGSDADEDGGTFPSPEEDASSPVDGSPPDGGRVAFVSSKAVFGDLVRLEANGRAGATKVCRDLAEAIPELKSRAWIAFIRTNGDAPGAPFEAGTWYRADGELLIEGGVPSFENRPARNLNVTEKKTVFALPTAVWTGETGKSDTSDCDDWRSDGGDRKAVIGNANANGESWINVGTQPCNQRARIYCFEQ